MFIFQIFDNIAATLVNSMIMIMWLGSELILIINARSRVGSKCSLVQARLLHFNLNNTDYRQLEIFITRWCWSVEYLQGNFFLDIQKLFCYTIKTPQLPGRKTSIAKLQINIFDFYVSISRRARSLETF